MCATFKLVCRYICFECMLRLFAGLVCVWVLIKQHKMRMNVSANLKLYTVGIPRGHKMDLRGPHQCGLVWAPVQPTAKWSCQIWIKAWGCPCRGKVVSGEAPRSSWDLDLVPRVERTTLTVGQRCIAAVVFRILVDSHTIWYPGKWHTDTMSSWIILEKRKYMTDICSAKGTRLKCFMLTIKNRAMWLGQRQLSTNFHHFVWQSLQQMLDFME